MSGYMYLLHLKQIILPSSPIPPLLVGFLTAPFWCVHQLDCILSADWKTVSFSSILCQRNECFKLHECTKSTGFLCVTRWFCSRSRLWDVGLMLVNGHDMPNSLLELCPAPRILGGECSESSSHHDPSSQSPAPQRQGFEARPKASKRFQKTMFFLSEKVKRDE